MAELDRLPRWTDWILALVAGIIVMNLDVTSAGDPLSGVGLSAEQSSPGITEGARATFYAVLAFGGLLLTSLAVALAFATPVARRAGRLLVTTFPLVALAGVLGLLLDYRDGPVRLVQSFAYVALAVGIVRLARVVVIAADATSDDDADAPRRVVPSGDQMTSKDQV